MSSLWITSFLFLLIFSCGKKNDSKKEITEAETLRADGSNVQGVYQTKLTALNLNTTIGVIGAAGVHRSSDNFKAFVKVFLGEMDAVHRQSVHLGSRCPSVKDDVDGDGFIDERESSLVVGNVILPLDDDLDSLELGQDRHPMGHGIAGGYFYERSASFSRLFEDLRNAQKIPRKGISFHNKVIMVYGAGTQKEDLPIACGVLRKSERFPAELHDRDDPLTSGESRRRTVIRPTTPPHEEPEVKPPTETHTVRRPSIGQRVRRWFRNVFRPRGRGPRPTE